MNSIFAPVMVVGIVGVGATIALGMVGKERVKAIGRNPESAKQSFVPGILALALIEAVAIYAVVIAFMLLGKI